MNSISVSLITGMSIGFEYVEAMPEDGMLTPSLIIDIVVLRFIFTFGEK